MNDIHEEIRTQQDNYRDKTILFQTSMWAALLTINGLSLGAAALLTAVRPDFLRLCIIPLTLLPLLSSFLILWNYWTTAETYRKLLSKSVGITTEMDWKKERANILRVHRVVRKSECVSLICVALNIIIFVGAVLINYYIG